MNDGQTGIGSLRNARCISLTTFRRDGSPVSTPIWFNLIGDRIYVTTESGSWKVRRIAHNPRVEWAVCTQRGRITGPTYAGVARVMAPSELPAVLTAKKRRDVSFWVIHFLKRDQVGIEITPEP